MGLPQPGCVIVVTDSMTARNFLSVGNKYVRRLLSGIRIQLGWQGGNPRPGTPRPGSVGTLTGDWRDLREKV